MTQLVKAKYGWKTSAHLLDSQQRSEAQRKHDKPEQIFCLRFNTSSSIHVKAKKIKPDLWENFLSTKLKMMLFNGMCDGRKANDVENVASYYGYFHT